MTTSTADVSSTPQAKPQRRLAARLRSGAAVLAIAIGAGLFLTGVAQPAKAWLGQRLLDGAWREAQGLRLAASLSPGQVWPSAGLVGPAVSIQPWPGADIAPIGELRFPTLGARRLVLDRATGEAMAWAPGHIAGTAPLGGDGLTGVAAHRDTHFALLGDLATGDPLELETLDGRLLSYRVVRAHVVDSRYWKAPVIHDGPDVLMLSTCWPLTSMVPGPKRYILFAERIEEGEIWAGEAPAEAPMTAPDIPLSDAPVSAATGDAI